MCESGETDVWARCRKDAGGEMGAAEINDDRTICDRWEKHNVVPASASYVNLQVKKLYRPTWLDLLKQCIHTYLFSTYLCLSSLPASPLALYLRVHLAARLKAKCASCKLRSGCKHRPNWFYVLAFNKEICRNKQLKCIHVSVKSPLFAW